MRNEIKSFLYHFCIYIIVHFHSVPVHTRSSDCFYECNRKKNPSTFSSFLFLFLCLLFFNCRIFTLRFFTSSASVLSKLKQNITFFLRCSGTITLFLIKNIFCFFSLFSFFTWFFEHKIVFNILSKFCHCHSTEIAANYENTI